MKKEKRDATINLRVPSRLKERLSKESEREGMTLSDKCNDKLEYANNDNR